MRNNKINQPFKSVMTEVLIIMGTIFLVSGFDVIPSSKLDVLVHIMTGIIFISLAISIRSKNKIT